jgi:hypothetical protein
MYIAIWWVGVILSELYIRKEEICLKNLLIVFKSLIILIIILLINLIVNKSKIEKNLGFTSIGTSPFLELRHFIFALISLLFVIFWKNTGWKYFNQTIGLFQPFAIFSYGLYISHYVLIVQAHYLNQYIIDSNIRLCLYLIICILFSYILEKYIYQIIKNKVYKLF